MKITDFGRKPRSKRFTPRKPTRGGNTMLINREKEPPLSGQVQGLKAAQGEERFSRTLNKSMAKGIVLGYEFRMSPGQPKQTPGWLELDYFVQGLSSVVAISVKGASFVHLNTQAKDKFNEMLILTRLRKMGYSLDKVDSIWDWQLKTQADADKTARELGLYR